MAMTLPVGARPRRADAQRNHQRIVAAATVAFDAHGVGASLDDIARQAEVGPGTLYRHFPTREHLIAAALRESMAELIATGERLPRDLPPLPALRAWMLAMIVHASTYQGLPASVLHLTITPDESVMPGCESIQRITAALLAAAQATGNVKPDVTKDDLLALSNALAWVWERSRPSYLDRARMLEHIFTGITAPAPPR